MIRRTPLATLVLAAAIASRLAAQQSAAGEAPAAPPSPDPWPKTAQSGGATYTMYQPQLDDWDQYHLSAHAAVSVLAAGAKDPVFGVVEITAEDPRQPFHADGGFPRHQGRRRQVPDGSGRGVGVQEGAAEDPLGRPGHDAAGPARGRSRDSERAPEVGGRTRQERAARVHLRRKTRGAHLDRRPTRLDRRGGDEPHAGPEHAAADPSRLLGQRLRPHPGRLPPGVVPVGPVDGGVGAAEGRRSGGPGARQEERRGPDGGDCPTRRPRRSRRSRTGFPSSWSPLRRPS